MLLPIGTKAHIYVNRNVNKDLQKRAYFESLLISRFDIRDRLAYFFRLSNTIGTSSAKNMFAWQDELPVIHTFGDGEYKFEPEGLENKRLEELKFWAHVDHLPLKQIMAYLRRADLANIIHFYRMPIEVRDSIRNMDLLEAIQKQLTFAGDKKRNIMSLSCDLQEGTILIDNSTIDLGTVPKGDPCWIDVFDTGRISREQCEGLRKSFNDYFRHNSMDVNPKDGNIIREARSLDIKKQEPAEVIDMPETAAEAAEDMDEFDEILQTAGSTFSRPTPITNTRSEQYTEQYTRCVVTPDQHQENPEGDE